MTVDDKVRDEKIQHINKEAAKTLILLLGTIDWYEYLTSAEILLLIEAK